MYLITPQQLFFHLVLFLSHAFANPVCKPTPLSPDWPTLSQWASLNSTLSGRLLHPPPPAIACHSSPVSSEACAEITSQWTNFTFHQNNPVSVAWNNMANDSCLPSQDAPCSGAGYPVYVVNATSAADVKIAIDFARDNGVRLVVKASGHDYLKRSSAPFALSIWTRYMVGDYVYHDAFQPAGCNLTIETTAVAAGAGSFVSDIYANLALRNLTAVDGMGREITLGGYLTGGGHSPLSHLYGLGADQVYEVEMVTPGGDIVVANECANEDLFWAVRGGGGATFGVLTRITIRTIPSTPIALYDFTLYAPANSSTYWSLLSHFLTYFPTLSAANVSAYTYLYPSITLNTTQGPIAMFEAVLALPSPASALTLSNLWAPMLTYIANTYPNSTDITTAVKSVVFEDLESLYEAYADVSGAGVDKVVGSWLLPPDILSSSAFPAALQTFLGASGGRLYMVSGKGVWDAEPRGGGDAVNPAWRSALIHAVTSQSWTPLNETQQADAEYNINHVQTAALRQLAPDSGAYLNEAYWDEPNFQQAFWGNNYARLLEIKKAVDPDGVFWCHTCVGSEGWKAVGDLLCRT